MLRHPCDSWASVASAMVGDAFFYLLIWNTIYRLLDWMPPFDSQLKRANHRTLRLPPKEELAWAQLLEVVTAAIGFPIVALGNGVPPSPRMRRCYTWFSGGRPDDPLWSSKSGTMTEAEFRPDTLFESICNPERRRLHSLNHLLQEVQYMLDTDQEAGGIVDSWSFGHYSDLAMLSEFKLRIEGRAPWCESWMFAKLQESAAVKGEVNKVLNLDIILVEALQKACKTSKYLIDTRDSCWEYPIFKSRTEANVEKMRSAEAKLDPLWIKLEDEISTATHLSLTKVIKVCTLEPREVLRTSEWIRPLVEWTKMELLLRDVNVPSFGHSSASPERAATIDQARMKTRVKTRTITTAAATDEKLARDAAHLTDQVTSSMEPFTQRIKVPKRAYKVLLDLLPESSAADYQRVEIAWTELLQALDTIGLQPEKLYGSVWMFKPKLGVKPLLQLKRSIQFHEPKEVRKGHKISASLLRRFGQRLKHAFGWEDGMFVCE